MSASIDYLPIWKKDATACERLQELAEVARKYPERFGKFALGYIETLPNGNTKIRTFTHGCSTVESVGVFEIAKNDLIDGCEV